jgi:hypothetical protein
MRETREITTPGGHTLSIHTYLTGREARDLQVPYLKTSEEYPKEIIDAKGIRAASFQAVQNLSLKTIIVSFDGKKDGDDGFDLVETVLDLPTSEFKFIVQRINEVISDPEGEDQKKTN